jgi:hypothetical protein
MAGFLLWTFQMLCWNMNKLGLHPGVILRRKEEKKKKVE